MEVDIQIYVKRLKDFFDTDEEARRDMFGNGQVLIWMNFIKWSLKKRPLILKRMETQC